MCLSLPNVVHEPLLSLNVSLYATKSMQQISVNVSSYDYMLLRASFNSCYTVHAFFNG